LEKNYLDNLPILLTEVGIAGIDMDNPDQFDHSNQIQSLWWLTELSNLDYLLAFLEKSTEYPLHAIIRHMLLVKRKGKLGRSILQWGGKSSINKSNIKQGWNPVLNGLFEKVLMNFEGGEFSPIETDLPHKTCNTLKYKGLNYSPLSIAEFQKGPKKGFYILNKTSSTITIDLPRGNWNIETISQEPDKIPKNFGNKDHLIKKMSARNSVEISPYSFNIGLNF